MRRHVFSSLLLAVAVGLSACGSDTQKVDTKSGGSGSRTCESPNAPAGEPSVKLPDAPATELGITDDKAGDGQAVIAHDTVKVNYIGCGQISGKRFDSSWSNGAPVEFSIDGVIPGWTQGLLGMKIGGRRTLVIPGDLAYGANPPGADIKPNETLVFVVDLISIKAGPDPKVVAAVDARGKPKVTVPDAPATELKITDDIVGTGTAVAAGSTVTVHYVGVGQITKKQFDASWDRGQPAEFNVNQVIKGWTEGLMGMKVGGRRTLVIPGDLAYGATPGSPDIKPNETLVFVVDLIAVS